MSLAKNTIEYRGATISYWMIGDTSKPALLLLHPAFSDHNIFIEQFSHLKDDYFMLAPDMIGHGKSQKGRSKVTMGDMPEILYKLLAVSGISQCHVVGVSMGSLVAQGFADKYPGNVTSVTIVGGYSIHKDNSHIKKRQSREALKWLGYILFSMKKFRDYIVDVSVYSKSGQVVFRTGAEQFKRSSFTAMQGMDRIFRDTEEPVDYPLLIICGEHDLELARDAGKRLEKLEQNARYAEINKAGHCANIDNPSEFNRLISEFTSSL